MNRFRITILMPVYNCDSTLSEALDSLIGQTYKHWKCVLCDDCSTDNTYKIAEDYCNRYSDKFILIKNDINQGLNISLNNCLSYADTEYIARMDGDDISVSERLEKEIAFLDNNKKFDVVSCPMIYFDKAGEFRIGSVPEIPSAEQVVLGSCVCHGPSMTRTAAIKNVGGYSVGKKIMRVEDVDLWIKLYVNGSRFYNIQTPLYKMRDDRNAIKRRKYKYRINSTMVRLRGCNQLRLGFICKIKCFSPMVIGLIPKPIYVLLHRRKKSS